MPRGFSAFLRWGKGDYGEGDIFIGIRTPKLRKLASRHLSLPLGVLRHFLRSKIHEERLFALILLVEKFKLEEKRGNEPKKRALYLFYRRHFPFINNWDLVDISCPHIVGRYLAHKDKSILMTWAKSPHLWTRRVAMVSHWWWIRNGDLSTVFKVAKLLLEDRHDLIHKAVGWMLREADKKNRKKDRGFPEKIPSKDVPGDVEIRYRTLSPRPTEKISTPFAPLEGTFSHHFRSVLPPSFFFINLLDFRK